MYASLNASCDFVQCSELSGDALTRRGEMVGFPRTQCNIVCSRSGMQTIENDEIYCRLIEAHLISRQGPNMANLCEALRCLSGDNAFIISSDSGLTQVSAGRTLTNEELCLLPAFKSCIPHVCGTAVEVYDIEDFSNIVGINCGGCNIYADSCSGASTLCEPVGCPENCSDCFATDAECLPFECDDTVIADCDLASELLPFECNLTVIAG